MADRPQIIADLIFLPLEAGGRSRLPRLPWLIPGQSGYMPHVVVNGEDDYLGVRYIDGPQPLFGESGDFLLELCHERIDFSSLVPGAELTVREGEKIVAIGTARERLNASQKMSKPE